MQSIVTVGRIGGEPFESICSKSSLGLNCVVQHLSFLATGENSVGSFYVLSQARYQNITRAGLFHTRVGSVLEQLAGVPILNHSL